MTDRPPPPVGEYLPFALHEGLVFVSAISSAEDGRLITGKAGRDLDLADARRAAERAARNLLGVLAEAAGHDLSRVGGVLMLRGHVNAAEDFALVHQVVDAASEVVIGALGERGRHARTAIGCATLPNNNAVTLEAIAFLAPGRGETA